MNLRTANGGYVATGGALSITNGVTRDVKHAILKREAADKERRKAYRKARTIRPGAKGDTFKEYQP
jgi:hypothetical protein